MLQEVHTIDFAPNRIPFAVQNLSEMYNYNINLILDLKYSENIYLCVSYDTET